MKKKSINVSHCFLNTIFISWNKNGINFWLKKPNFHHPRYTPINADELKVDSGLVNFASEIGLLSIYEGTEENVKRYKVPDLFIHGLKMKRKGQK